MVTLALWSQMTGGEISALPVIMFPSSLAWVGRGVRNRSILCPFPFLLRARCQSCMSKSWRAESIHPHRVQAAQFAQRLHPSSPLSLPGVALLSILTGRRRRAGGEVNRWSVSSWKGEKKPPSLFHLTAASRRLFHLILSKLQGGVQFEEQ